MLRWWRRRCGRVAAMGAAWLRRWEGEAVMGDVGDRRRGGRRCYRSLMASCRRRKSEADAGRDVISELPSEVKDFFECFSKYEGEKENKTVEIFVEHVVDDQWDYEVEMTYISDEVRMMNEIYANAIATPLSLGEGPSNFVAAMRRKDIKFVKNEGRRYENKIINSGFLAKFYKDEFRLNTSWGRMVFQEHVKAKFNCQLSMHQSYRAKKQALKYLEGSEGEQFDLLHDYCEELRKTNPGLNYSAKFQNGQAQAAEIEVGRNEAEFEKEDAFENDLLSSQSTNLMTSGGHTPNQMSTFISVEASHMTQPNQHPGIINKGGRTFVTLSNLQQTKCQIKRNILSKKHPQNKK
nr:Zinc knuckle family protein [Ipomoea batatas]